MAILTVFTVLEIHGSSIGQYHNILFGEEEKNASLIFGEPKPVRSDEWLGWTQHTIRQDKLGYPAFDNGKVSGQDSSKNPETPTSSWVNYFRPQNVGFLVLPFENAFALRWWLPPVILAIAAYFFILRILPSKRLLASLLSTSFVLSPFLLWWYQSGLFMVMAYGFITMILGIRVIDQERVGKIKSSYLSNLIYVVAVAYIFTSSVLYFYPPYLIPVFLVVAFYISGLIIHRLLEKHIGWKTLLKRLSVFAVAATLSMAIGLFFLQTHQAMVQGTLNTIYPGARKTESGGMHWLPLFDGFLMPELQDEKDGSPTYYDNKSEASNFILLLPFLILPGMFVLINDYRDRKDIDWIFLLLNLCFIILIARVFLPLGDSLYGLLFLDRVPHLRLISGFGFLGFIYLITLIRKVSNSGISKKKLDTYALAYVLICAFVLFFIGKYVLDNYPGFINNYQTLALMMLLFTLIIFAFISNRKYLGATSLLVFTLFSSYNIVPLYRSLDTPLNLEILQRIDNISKPGDKWITTDDLYFINLPAMAGEDVISGSQGYPDLEYWKDLGYEGYEEVYNRQARAVFVTTKPSMKKMELIQPNYFQIKFECRDRLIEEIDYILAIAPISEDCVSLIDTVEYPRKTFYIYSM